MRIAHILMSLGSGGIAGLVFPLACEQAKKGNQVMLIVTDECDTEHSFKQEKILGSYGVSVVRLNRKKGNKLSFFSALFRCRKIVKSFAPDIVNSHASMWHLFGAFSCFATKCHHVATIHSAREKWNKITQLACRNVPIIYCSKAASESGLHKSTNSIVVTNGVSSDLIKTRDVVDLRKDFKLPENAKVIVSVGNLRPPKNYKNLIELAKLLDGSNIHFFICGGNFGGPAYDDPKTYEGYDNLHCLGARSDVSAIENGADLFLSSSLYEGLPVAVLEAYFLGVPCVLSPIKEHYQISDVSNVWIPNEFTPKAFVDTIKEALKASENLTHQEIFKMRESKIEKYGIGYTADNYLSFYNKCLS